MPSQYYDGTHLVQSATPEDINKGNLDLLQKINEVSKATGNQLPLGFIYIQWPAQPTPDALYGTTSNWENISSQFAGDFFRVEGGNAGDFALGAEQGDAIRNILGSFKAGGTNNVSPSSTASPTGVFTEGSTAVDYLNGGSAMTISLHTVTLDASTKVPTASENRPVNRTIRVWKKVKSASATTTPVTTSTTTSSSSLAIYLSNSETVVNTNGAVAKTVVSIDGSPLVANTAITYYDVALPRALLPNEHFVLQFKGKKNGAWADAQFCGVDSLFIPSLMGQNFIIGSTSYIRGMAITQPNAGQLRIRFSTGFTTSASSWNYSANLDKTWAQVIAAEDGFDAWRVVIKS